MRYKITKVSDDEPKVWGEGERKTYYIKVMLEGHEKPVTIGKKKPGALSVGMTVEGDIIPTEYAEDKFKASTGSFGGGGGKTHDPDSMYRCNALNNAVAWCAAVKKGDTEDVVKVADDFLTWLKGENKGYEAAKKTAEALKPEPKPEAEPMPVYQDEEIDLDSIPF